MTDLEITRLCAEAMDYEPLSANFHPTTGIKARTGKPGGRICYDPLHDDAQAMALVKKFHLHIIPVYSEDHSFSKWSVWKATTNGDDISLNRAICECVAKLQSNLKAKP